MPHAAFLKKLILALDTHLQSWQERGLCVALSGGADSVALLRALLLLRDDEALLTSLLAELRLSGERKTSRNGGKRQLVSPQETAARPSSTRSAQHDLERLSAANGGAKNDDKGALIYDAKRYLHCLRGLRAAHCNFQLRGEESDADELFVRRLCDSFAVKLDVAHFDTANEARNRGESIEMAARRLRYEWFSTFNEVLLVAHHADDNAETLLLNLIRGSGIRGLAAMPLRNGAGVLRPLLNCQRNEITAFLNSIGQDFRNDSSNTDTAFRRNMIRHQLLPLLAETNPKIHRTLADTAQRLQEAIGVFEMGLQWLDEKILLPTSCDNYLRMSLPEILMAGQAGRTWLHERLHPRGFNSQQIDNLLRTREGAVFFSKGAAPFIATRTADTIEVASFNTDDRPELRFSELAMTDDFQPSRLPQIATIDAETTRGELRLRRVEVGDRFAPFGMRNGSQLVSDWMSNRKRSRIEKLRAYCLCDDVGIVWLVGECVAQRVAVGKDTRRVLKIEWIDHR